MGCALLAGLGRELQRFIGAKLQPAFPGTVGNDRLLARALWLALNGDDFRISIDAPAPLRNPISLATTDTAIVKPFLQLRILLGRRASSLTPPTASIGGKNGQRSYLRDNLGLSNRDKYSISGLRLSHMR
jgi:hypothetical protein